MARAIIRLMPTRLDIFRGELGAPSHPDPLAGEGGEGDFTRNLEG
jgi:hypothetical protein